MKQIKEATYTKEEQALRREYAFEQLSRHIREGMTIYTNCNSVSKSGMSRRIRCYIAIVDDGKPEIMDITFHVSQVCGYSMNDAGLLVRGCGMDMGFFLAYELSRVLFAGQLSVDRAGYALRQRWL